MFLGCTNVNTIDFFNEIKEIDADVFNGCTNSEALYPDIVFAWLQIDVAESNIISSNYYLTNEVDKFYFMSYIPERDEYISGNKEQEYVLIDHSLIDNDSGISRIKDYGLYGLKKFI